MQKPAFMIPRHWSTPLLLAILAVAVSSVPLAGQQLPREVARRTVGVGTYGGTMQGQAPPRFVAGSQLDEEMSCDVTLQFTADGNLTAELRRYSHVKTETKRSQAGDFKIITRITGQSGRLTVPSSLFLWVTTPGNLVQNAQWQHSPGPEFPGQVDTEVLRHVGQNRWQRVDYKSSTLTVYCFPRVLWQGETGQGSGLPLRSTYRGPDYYGKRTWVTINAGWNLTPVAVR